jgi:hypothetical protein
MISKKSTKTQSLDKYLLNFKKINFEPIDATKINDFPRLNIDVIKNELTFVSYQLKNVFGYLAEHFDKNNGEMELVINTETMNNNKLNIYLRKFNCAI